MKILLFIACFMVPCMAYSQTCPGAAGNETSYGTNNQWIGYVYDNPDFTNYHGYITEGAPSNPNFDEGFGGDYDSIHTVGGCAVYTENFSVRYKLQQNFEAGDYDIIVGADDGLRLSIDGGSTWIINDWAKHAYYAKNVRVHLSGLTNLVLEYYENTVLNRVSFGIYPVCLGTGSETIYGNNNQWIGYVYSNEDFSDYKGTITEGSPSSANFFEDFGTTEGFAATNQCHYVAEFFSVRFRLTKQFTPLNYTFTVGGDDGYRLSFDGGNTWAIENFVKHSYTTSSKSFFLDGSYNMVLEYFDEDGDNIVSFELKEGSLPIQLVSFAASRKSNTQNQLNWSVSNIQQAGSFSIERSSDGHLFQSIGMLNTTAGSTEQSFSFIDEHPLSGNNFYRLKLLEAGTAIYSTVRLVESRNTKSVLVFPNPVKGRSFNFSAPANSTLLQIRLYDAAGRLIHQNSFTQISAGQVLPVQLPTSITKGNYLFICVDKDGNSSNQLISIQ